MRVSNQQLAPQFTVTDVFGETIALSQFKGKKVHLIFYRFAACPFCNLRFHEINQLADTYKQHNTVVLSVYESSAANIRTMMADGSFYTYVIPNPDSTLYKLFNLERSMLGLLQFLLFNGGLSRAMKGRKLFKNRVSGDGHSDRLEAEFLIDENGRVVQAHYGKIQGDYLPKSEILAFMDAKPAV